MRKLILSSLLACSIIFVSCDQTTSESQANSPSPESAAQLRENNLALVRNLQALKGRIEARSAARLAARSTASPVEVTPMMPAQDFGAMKAQIRSALQASGACQPWIDFVVNLFDLLEQMMNADQTNWTEADYLAWEDDLMALFSRALACLEPLLQDVTASENPDMAALMSGFQQFDRCICGSAGGSIFGNSAALVYGYYGLPSTGTSYSAPSSPGGDTYGRPGSPAGTGYGAPTLFPR